MRSNTTLCAATYSFNLNAPPDTIVLGFVSGFKKALNTDSPLSEYGLKCNGCMSQEIIEKSINCKLEPPKKKNLRQECNCLMGNDIGAYNTCGHLCKYCYANADTALVRENMRRHNPRSLFLVGESMPDDVIHDAKQKSWIDGQMRLIL